MSSSAGGPANGVTEHTTAVNVTTVPKNLRVAVEEQIKGSYDSYYDGRSEWRRICAVDKVRNIQELTRGFSFSDVIEVGTGEGSVLARLDQVRFAPNLYGLEISESGLAATRARTFERVRGVEPFDGYRVPYPDDRFDLAVATHVLEHVEHERMFLRELRRISRNVVIEVPLEDTWRVGRAIDNEIGHINFYRSETVLALLRSVGLRPVRYRTFDISLAATTYRRGRVMGRARHVVRRSLLRLAPTLATRFVTYHFGVLATRES